MASRDLESSQTIVPGEPQQVVERAWAAVQSHEWDRLTEFFHPSYVRHTGTAHLRFDDFRRLLREEHAAFPDTVFDLDEFVPGADRVAFRWSSRATHLGSYLDVPPTGRRVAVSGITISRIQDGKIVEDWTSWNKHELLTTLGIIPIESGGSPAGRQHADGSGDAATALRAVHRAFPTGVTIVTTSEDGAPAGLAVNAFSSVSLDPPLVLFCVGKTALTYPRLFAGDAVGINVLASDQAAIAERFALSGGDKFAGLGWSPGASGAPLLDSCAAVLEGVIENRIPIATHAIFIARVERAKTLGRAPLLYLGGRFFDTSGIGAT
jgi:flavin reductase (DIM6/NTAB) family NADH-FMN oxidoreductase RutF/predicted ester cyclase